MRGEEEAEGTQAPPIGILPTLLRIGPGLVLAGSIVGSGELIATTTTGAQAGFTLLWLVLAGCLVKVFAQVEFGRAAVARGCTALGALDELPGPRLRVGWGVWAWVAMTLLTLAQQGGIVGGVGSTLAQSVPLTDAGRARETAAEEVTELQIAEALARIRADVANRTELMDARLPKALRDLVPAELPAIARAGAQVGGALLGLELKSCRKGEFYLRWTEDDQLVVGYGNPARIPLPEGTTARLVALSKEAQTKVGAKVYWGRPGCDVESYRMPRATGPADLPQQLIVSKDERPAAGLRPAALSELGAALAASIPKDSALTAADVRTRELARRVRDCFASIGGAIGD